MTSQFQFKTRPLPSKFKFGSVRWRTSLYLNLFHWPMGKILVIIMGFVGTFELMIWFTNGFREQKDSMIIGQYHRKTTTVTLFTGKQLSSDFTNFLTASATSKRLHWPQNIVHSQPSSVLVIHSDSSRIILQIFIDTTLLVSLLNM